MLWNELSYEAQQTILDKIANLVSKESDVNIKQGLVAALNELDAWSNNPCPELIAKPVSIIPEPICNFSSYYKRNYHQPLLVDSVILNLED